VSNEQKSIIYRIMSYQSTDRPHIRQILEHIGWDKPYILTFEQPEVFDNP